MKKSKTELELERLKKERMLGNPQEMKMKKRKMDEYLERIKLIRSLTIQKENLNNERDYPTAFALTDKSGSYNLLSTKEKSKFMNEVVQFSNNYKKTKIWI